MAKRYSGDLQINVTYDNRNFYKTSVSLGGKILWRGTVNPAPTGFGPGSPEAYDEIAARALAFATDGASLRAMGRTEALSRAADIVDAAAFNEEITGYLIRRSPRKVTSGHARKKAQLGSGMKIKVAKVGGRWQPVYAHGVACGKIYNADGRGYATREGAEDAVAMFRKLGSQA